MAGNLRNRDLVGGNVNSYRGKWNQGNLGFINRAKEGEETYGNTYSSLNDKSEIKDNIKPVTENKYILDQEDSAVMTVPTVQSRKQGIQETSFKDDTLGRKEYVFVRDRYGRLYCVPEDERDLIAANGMNFSKGIWYIRNDGDNDYSFLLQGTEMNDNNNKLNGYLRDTNNKYILQNPLQRRLGGDVLGLSAMQGTTGNGTHRYDLKVSNEAVVAQNTTGTGFMADIAERESIAKMPLPSYLGYGVKDNYELIAEIEKQHEKEIELAIEIAKNIVPPVVLEIADKAVVFLPPPWREGARGVLIAIDIGLAVYEVYDQWDDEVELYEREHGCSREVAEQKVSLAKKVHDAFMIFSTHKWLQYAMRSAGHPADLKITVGVEVLKIITEDKLKEWGRMLTE